MEETGLLITDREVRPGWVAVLNVVALGIPLGYLRLGQRRKAWIGWIAVWVLLPVFGLGWGLALVFAYDAYRLAQRLAQGEAITEHQCAVDFLRWLPGFGWHADRSTR